jgi:hypothetical protein
MANRISAELKDGDATGVRQKIIDIKSLLPFLIEIDKTERKKGQKIGQASVGFVRASLNAAINNPDILAKKFSVEEFQKDLALYDSLSPLDDKLEELFQLVRDTILMLGKDLMEQANEVYGDVKKEAKKNNSLKPTADSLGEFYKKSKGEGKAPAKPA